MSAKTRLAETTLLAAIFLDLLGFGMVLPDVQLHGERLGLPGWAIGAILTSTFAVQFVASPLWGRISDQVGRKPILLAVSFLSASGLLLYGLAATPLLMLVSRVISGLGGANVSVAQAYASDITEKDQRTAILGRMGAAVSAGLIVGPALLAAIPRNSTVHVGYIAGASSLLGALLLTFALPSADVRQGGVGEQSGAVFRFTLLRRLPAVRTLVVAAVVGWFSLAILEGTFGRLIERTLHLGRPEYGAIFAYESVLGVVAQGFLLVWLATRTEDVWRLRVAFLAQGVGLGLTPIAPSLGILFLVSGVYALGSGIASGTINGLCSRLTPQDLQGELFGLLQGARSIGFMVGPVLGGVIFDRYAPAPYFIAAAASFVAVMLVRIPRDIR